MRKLTSSTLLITSIFLVIINQSCTTGKSSRPVVSADDSNLTNDNLHRQNNTTIEVKAFNKELLINIEGDTIAGYAFIAKGPHKKETIILIAGYPGNDSNFDVAQEIRQKGRNVITFNHRGAWGSQGTYTYSNCLQDITEIINYLITEEISEQLRIKKDDFTLLGRSFGGGIGLIQGSKIKAVKKIIAISSVNYGEIMKNYQSVDELGAFKVYMKKQIMMNHNIDQFLQELLDEKDQFNILNYVKELGNKAILFIEDSNKNEAWIKQIENSNYVIINSDHNFVNKRKEMIDLINNWLDNN